MITRLVNILLAIIPLGCAGECKRHNPIAPQILDVSHASMERRDSADLPIKKEAPPDPLAHLRTASSWKLEMNLLGVADNSYHYYSRNRNEGGNWRDTGNVGFSSTLRSCAGRSCDTVIRPFVLKICCDEVNKSTYDTTRTSGRIVFDMVHARLRTVAINIYLQQGGSTSVVRIHEVVLTDVPYSLQADHSLVAEIRGANIDSRIGKFSSTMKERGGDGMTWYDDRQSKTVAIPPQNENSYIRLTITP